jgi:cytochrome c-type biogenesis protein CcmH/NrfF
MKRSLPLNRGLLVLLGMSFASIAGAAGPGFTDCAVEDPGCSVPGTPVNTSFAARVVGNPAGKPLSGDALDLRTEQVAREIRCPVCQGSSIGDSPSSTARHMKQEVHDLLAAGFTQEQVLSYFESSYGEFVRLAPKTSGFTSLIWALPAVLLLGGIVSIAIFFRRRRPTAGVAQAATADVPLEDPSLEPWLKQVRGLVDPTKTANETQG